MFLSNLSAARQNLLDQMAEYAKLMAEYAELTNNLTALANEHAYCVGSLDKGRHIYSCSSVEMAEMFTEYCKHCGFTTTTLPSEPGDVVQVVIQT